MWPRVYVTIELFTLGFVVTLTGNEKSSLYVCVYIYKLNLPTKFFFVNNSFSHNNWRCLPTQLLSYHTHTYIYIYIYIYCMYREKVAEEIVGKVVCMSSIIVGWPGLGEDWCFFQNNFVCMVC